MLRLRDMTVAMAAVSLTVSLWALWPAPTESVMPDQVAAAAPLGPFAPVAITTPAPVVKTTPWSKVVGAGESLSSILADAGLAGADMTLVVDALGDAYDLQRLKPGHRVLLDLLETGAPYTAALEIEDGIRIRATFGSETTVEVVPPVLDTTRHAGEARISGSIYGALERAGIPTRFATDLELVFAGTLDLRAAMTGGETLRVLWRENASQGRLVGDPIIDFAELDLGDARYTVVWPGDDSRLTQIFRDDAPVLSFVQPIAGARLSSSFGPRLHPVHGTTRMHSGVDLSAGLGAVVTATAAGRIVAMERRSGYGLLVEVEHAGGVRTRYAHLSALNDALSPGDRVASGDEIGRVGNSGTSTAPHLHYEIIVNGRPVAPLTSTDLTTSTGSGHSDDALTLVESLQTGSRPPSADARLDRHFRSDAVRGPMRWPACCTVGLRSEVPDCEQIAAAMGTARPL